MYDLNKKNLLREVTVKIGLERIDIQEGITVEALLDSGATGCHMQVTSKKYKPAFHSGHLSCNTSYGSTATLWVFCLPWWRYSYSTQSSMTELLLLVSQH